MKEVDVLGLLLGAGLAIAGGLIGQLVAHWLKSAESKRLHRRDKLDELMVSLVEDHHWLNDFRISLCFGDGKHAEHEPFDRVNALAVLYFKQDLAVALNSLIEKRFKLREAITQVSTDRLTRAMAEEKALKQTLPDPEKLEATLAAFETYYLAFGVMRDACAKIALK